MVDPSSGPASPCAPRPSRASSCLRVGAGEGIARNEYALVIADEHLGCGGPRLSGEAQIFPSRTGPRHLRYPPQARRHRTGALAPDFEALGRGFAHAARALRDARLFAGAGSSIRCAPRVPFGRGTDRRTTRRVLAGPRGLNSCAWSEVFELLHPSCADLRSIAGSGSRRKPVAALAGDWAIEVGDRARPADVPKSGFLARATPISATRWGQGAARSGREARPVGLGLGLGTASDRSRLDRSRRAELFRFSASRPAVAARGAADPGADARSQEARELARRVSRSSGCRRGADARGGWLRGEAERAGLPVEWMERSLRVGARRPRGRALEGEIFERPGAATRRSASQIESRRRGPAVGWEAHGRGQDLDRGWGRIFRTAGGSALHLRATRCRVSHARGGAPCVGPRAGSCSPTYRSMVAAARLVDRSRMGQLRRVVTTSSAASRARSKRSSAAHQLPAQADRPAT